MLRAQTASIVEMFPKCYGRIDADGSRFLLADQEGRLFVIVLNKEGHEVCAWGGGGGVGLGWKLEGG